MANVTVPVEPHGAGLNPTHLRHHFATPEQQFDSAMLGMWTFLVTEVLFFGGMFTAYAIYRTIYHDAFASTSQYMNVILGGTNTAVLICSSLSMAMAVRFAQISKSRPMVISLLLTMFFGTIFLLVKAFEYHDKWEEWLVPGLRFDVTRYASPEFAHHAQILFFLYFAMTGMHALHMIIGLGLLTYLVVQGTRNVFSSAYYTPVEMIGLYWHFVDVVWIFLFPLLYLIGHRK